MLKHDVPNLNFCIESAEALEYAASPSLLFKLRLENAGAAAIRSIMLTAQIRIMAGQRPYNAREQENLVELFGEKQRWGTTLKSLLWTHASVLVPTFTGSIVVDLPALCTYDFEVASAKYFHNLEEGVIPLEFLFSGTMFYEGGMGLQAAQIPWEKEARFQMPVRLWQQMMEHYFPNSAWLRVRKDVFDRLYRYKTGQGLASWEDALDKLLDGSEEVS